MWKELQIRRYIWEVSRELPGSRKRKKKILSRVENSVREFASEQQNTDYAAIVKWFGPPEKIAESFVLEMDAAELVQRMKIRYKVLLIVISAVAILSAVRFAFLAAAYVNHERDLNGYAVVEIIVIEETEFDEGEN